MIRIFITHYFPNFQMKNAFVGTLLNDSVLHRFNWSTSKILSKDACGTTFGIMFIVELVRKFYNADVFLRPTHQNNWLTNRSSRGNLRQYFVVGISDKSKRNWVTEESTSSSNSKCASCPSYNIDCIAQTRLNYVSFQTKIV